MYLGYRSFGAPDRLRTGGATRTSNNRSIGDQSICSPNSMADTSGAGVTFRPSILNGPRGKREGLDPNHSGVRTTLPAAVDPLFSSFLLLQSCSKPQIQMAVPSFFTSCKKLAYNTSLAALTPVRLARPAEQFLPSSSKFWCDHKASWCAAPWNNPYLNSTNPTTDNCEHNHSASQLFPPLTDVVRAGCGAPPFLCGRTVVAHTLYPPN